ncbi:MAG TPA: GAF domain-containing sensor histidine kinase [Gemmatimonadales bacterium]
MAARNPAVQPPEETDGRLEERLRFETLLADIASRFVNLPPEEVQPEIEQAQRQVCDLLGLDRSTFWRLVDADPPTFSLVSVAKAPGSAPLPSEPDARTLFPWVTDRILRGDAVLLARLEDLPPEAARDRQTFEQVETRSTGIFPLWVGGRVAAAISFASTVAGQEWPSPRVARFGLVAQVFGSALSRKFAHEALLQSKAALRDLSARLIQAQERERAWLATELHDGLNQQLAMLAVELDLLGQLPPAGPDALQARLAALSAQAKALSADVHRLSHGLHPSKLERLGLVAAIRGFCRELGAGSVAVRFSSSDVPRAVPQDLALCLYRVAQESLWNVLRHSGARQAVVELHATETAIHLHVMDDGKGFDPEAAASHDSLGLVSMRERVATVGGAIHWESSPGRGTTVVAQVPLPPEGAT